MDLASASESCLNPFIEKVEVKNHAAKTAADRKIHVIERDLPPGQRESKAFEFNHCLVLPHSSVQSQCTLGYCFSH